MQLSRPFPAGMQVLYTREKSALLLALHPACWDAGRTSNDMDIMFTHGRWYRAM